MYPYLDYQPSLGGSFTGCSGLQIKANGNTLYLDVPLILTHKIRSNMLPDLELSQQTGLLRLPSSQFLNPKLQLQEM